MVKRHGAVDPPGRRRSNTFARQRRVAAVSETTSLGPSDPVTSWPLEPSRPPRSTSPSRKRGRHFTPVSPSSTCSEDSIYSAYDFVNEMMQDIVLDHNSDDDDGKGFSAPLTFFSPLSSRCRSGTNENVLAELVVVPPAKPRRRKSKPPLLAKPSCVAQFSIAVVLDVDETLLSTQDHGVFLRPHVEDFIHTCHALRCEVIVWTAGATAYANGLFAAIARACRMELWYHHAVTRHPKWFEESDRASGVKDVRRLQRDLRRVLIIENNPASVIKQPRNAILVEDYTTPNADDRTFRVLQQILQELVPMTSATAAGLVSKGEKILTCSVPEALQKLKSVTTVKLEVSEEKSLDSFALRYSPTPKGVARRYGAVASK